MDKEIDLKKVNEIHDTFRDKYYPKEIERLLGLESYKVKGLIKWAKKDRKTFSPIGYKDKLTKDEFLHVIFLYLNQERGPGTEIREIRYQTESLTMALSIHNDAPEERKMQVFGEARKDFRGTILINNITEDTKALMLNIYSPKPRLFKGITSGSDLTCNEFRHQIGALPNYQSEVVLKAIRMDIPIFICYQQVDDGRYNIYPTELLDVEDVPVIESNNKNKHEFYQDLWYNWPHFKEKIEKQDANFEEFKSFKKSQYEIIKDIFNNLPK